MKNGAFIRNLCLATPLLGSASPGCAEEIRLSLKSAMVFSRPALESERLGRTEALADHTVRAHWLTPASDAIQWDFAAEVSPQVFSAEFPISALPPFRYRLWDFDRLAMGEGRERGMRIAQNLDRLAASLSWAQLDVSVGRQPLTLGVARRWNVLDLPSTRGDIGQLPDTRIGYDALKIRIPLGDLEEIEVAAVGGRGVSGQGSPGAELALVKARTNWGGLSLTATTLTFAKNQVLGFSLETPLKDAGFWIEGALTSNDLWMPDHLPENNVRAAVGADYALSEGTWLMGELGYNGAAQTTLSRTLRERGRLASYRDGRVTLLQRHHVALAARRQLLPQLTADGDALACLDDHSGALSSTLTWEAGNLWSVALTGQWPFGAGRDTRGVPQSEFGAGERRFVMTTRADF